jgi:hypothetical protein
MRIQQTSIRFGIKQSKMVENSGTDFEMRVNLIK